MGVEFDADAVGVTQGQVDVRVRVAAHLVSLGHDPPDDARIVLRLLPRMKNVAGAFFFLENVQDLRGPLRVGPVVEGQRHLVFAACPLVVQRGIFRGTCRRWC